MNIRIEGVITTSDDIDHSEFLEKFLEWLESRGWTFFGVTKESADE